MVTGQAVVLLLPLESYPHPKTKLGNNEYQGIESSVRLNDFMTQTLSWFTRFTAYLTAR
jgi:hypothetical protein